MIKMKVGENSILRDKIITGIKFNSDLRNNKKNKKRIYNAWVSWVARKTDLSFNYDKWNDPHDNNREKITIEFYPRGSLTTEEFFPLMNKCLESLFPHFHRKYALKWGYKMIGNEVRLKTT